MDGRIPSEISWVLGVSLCVRTTVKVLGIGLCNLTNLDTTLTPDALLFPGICL